MSKVLHHKVVVALPLPLEPDSIYYVRKGDGFDIHVTNGAGVVTAYSLNAEAQVTGLLDRLDSIDSLIGDVESVLVAINGEP